MTHQWLLFAFACSGEYGFKCFAIYLFYPTAAMMPFQLKLFSTDFLFLLASRKKIKTYYTVRKGLR